VLKKLDRLAWLIGASHQSIDVDSTVDLTYLPPLTCPLPSCVFPTKTDLSQTRFYGYFFYEAGPMFSWTGGITLLKEQNETDSDLKKGYPKLGLRLEPNPDNEVRLAVFRNRVSVILPSLYETLEPTQIAGFNELYDDIGSTDSWNYTAAYKHRFSKDLRVGISSIYRKLDTKIDVFDLSTPFPTLSSQRLEYDDKYANIWLNWTPSPRWSLGVEYAYNRYDLEKGIHSSDSSILAPDGVLKLTTHKIPASLSFFHPSGIISKLTATYYNQEGNFVDSSGMTVQEGEDSGVVTDLSLSYRFQQRIGSASIGVKNLFDNHLNQEDRSSYDVDDPASSASPSSFSGERIFYGKVSLNFR